MTETKWFPDDAKGIFPTGEFPRGKKNSADLALARASIEDERFLSLNPTEQRIISARFFPEDGLPSTFGELGKELGMSGSTVRKTQERILKKLQKPRARLDIPSIYI